MIVMRKPFVACLFIVAILTGCGPQRGQTVEVQSFHQEPRAIQPLVMRGTGREDSLHIDADRLTRSIMVGGDGVDTLVFNNAGPVMVDGKQLRGIDVIDARNQQQNDIEVLFSAIENSDHGVMVIEGDNQLDHVRLDPRLVWDCPTSNVRHAPPGPNFRLFQPNEWRFRQAIIWVAEGVMVTNAPGCR